MEYNKKKKLKQKEEIPSCTKYNPNYSLRQNKILSKPKWRKITDLNHKLNKLILYFLI